MTITWCVPGKSSCKMHICYLCVFQDKRGRHPQQCLLDPLWPHNLASQMAVMVKNRPANAGDIRDAVSTPELGRSPGERHGNPLLVFLPGESHGQRSLPGWLQSIGSQRIRQDWSNLACMTVQPLSELGRFHSTEWRKREVSVTLPRSGRRGWQAGSPPTPALMILVLTLS